MLGVISTEKLCYVVARARQFDVKEADSDPDSGSNAADDGMTDVLEDKRDDPVRRELVEYINGLNVDEKAAVLAMAWIGRGTYDKAEWDEAFRTAQGEVNGRTAQYLLGLPLLGDYLSEAMAAFGESCEIESIGRM
jgi:hypothetical protein